MAPGRGAPCPVDEKTAEFGPDRLVGVTGHAWQASLWDALALVLGTLFELALGLDTGKVLLRGGVAFISSSAVIAKLIIDLGRAAYPESEVVLGVLVFEDLVIAVVLALAAGHGGMSALLATLVVITIYGAVARFLGGRLAELAHQASGELLLLLGTAVTIGTAEVLRAGGAPESIGALLEGQIPTPVSGPLGAGVFLSDCDPNWVSVAFYRPQGSETVHQPLHTNRAPHALTPG